jgi:SSS family solute:Na+ symporter
MPLLSLDLLVFVFYLLGIIVFGASFYFKKRNSLDYTTGSGKLPSWALGMSIFATYLSSISFLALPGNAYSGNWNAFVFSLSIPLASVVAIFVFVPLYRKIQSPSAYAYFEERFGLWARIYASACYLLTQLARMGAILYLLALPMHLMLGWSITHIIWVTGLGVVLYATLGGLEAVVWTDAIQGIILIIGALACFVFILLELPGGYEQFWSEGAKLGKFSLGPYGWSWSESTFWLVLIYGLFINLQNFGVDQSYIQRYLGAKDIQSAQKSTALGSLLYIPVSLLFFMIGSALFVYYQHFPSYIPLEILKEGDKVFPYFILHALPDGISGLLIAGIFAAGMSTLSTSINGSATVILEDHVKKYLHPKISEKESMNVLYLSSAGIGLLSILVGLAFNGVESALDAWWALASIFSGGILGLFFLGLLSPNLSKFPAIIGVIIGILVITGISLGEYFPTLNLPIIHKNWAIVMGTMAIIIMGFLIGVLMSKKSTHYLSD